MEHKDLLLKAAGAITKSVTVHGGRVGSAVEMKDGTILTGFNFESRGVPIVHAEVTAVLKAYDAGYTGKDFKAMAIVCNFPGLFPACAACRQFLWEHTNPEMEIIAFEPNIERTEVFKLRDLYPYPFPSEGIKEIVHKDISGGINDKEEKGNEPSKEIVIDTLRNGVSNSGI